MRFSPFFIGGVRGKAKDAAYLSDVDKLELSTWHHIHTHKNLHSAMYAVWRKKNPPQETGNEANANTKTQRG